MTTIRIIQTVQLLLSFISIIFVVRAYREARMDQQHLSVSPERNYDGSEIAAAGNVQRERLLLATHILLFIGVGMASFFIPLHRQEWRIITIRLSVILATLILLRVSITAWRKRQAILTLIRERRKILDC